MTTTPSRPRPRSLVLLLSLVALAVLGLVAPTGASASPYCGITWGSLDSSSATGSGGYVDGVRSGRHTCYDRLVIDVTGTSTYRTWQAGYAPRIIADPSGKPVSLRGGAFLGIRLAAPTATPNGTETYAPAFAGELVDVTGYRTFRQVALTGSFEGITNIALGVRARLPFRVFTLSGPNPGQTRLVVDVAHLW